jgi:hypothetical protein
MQQLGLAGCARGTEDPAAMRLAMIMSVLLPFVTVR